MEISRHWRLRKQRYGLVGGVCPHCEAKFFPPRQVCPECGREESAQYQVSEDSPTFAYTPAYEPQAAKA